MSPVRDVIRELDGRHWFGIGTVLDQQGGLHYDLHGGEDVTVEVELHPSGRVISCRVAAAGGGRDAGAWRIPQPGDEVAVAVPDGEEDAGGIVLGALSTGLVPTDVGGTTFVVKAPKVVVISSDVQLGADGLAPEDGVVTGRAIDSFTGLTQFQLGNASASIKARKT